MVGGERTEYQASLQAVSKLIMMQSADDDDGSRRAATAAAAGGEKSGKETKEEDRVHTHFSFLQSVLFFYVSEDVGHVGFQHHPPHAELAQYHLGLKKEAAGNHQPPS